MPVELGSEFQDTEPKPDPFLQALLYFPEMVEELVGIRDSMAAIVAEFASIRIPAPIVQTDQEQVIEAIEGLNIPKPPTAEEVGKAVAKHLPQEKEQTELLQFLKDARKALDKVARQSKNLASLTPAVLNVDTVNVDSDVSDRENRQVGVVTTTGVTEIANEATLQDLKRGITDQAALVDIGVTGGSTDKTIYAGKAIQGTTGTGTWNITRIWYDTNGKVRETQVLNGVWTNRASLAWKAPEDPAWSSA